MQTATPQLGRCTYLTWTLYVYCAREGGAYGVAPIPLECAPNLNWPLPDIEFLPCVLSFEFTLKFRLALCFMSY